MKSLLGWTTWRFGRRRVKYSALNNVINFTGHNFADLCYYPCQHG